MDALCEILDRIGNAPDIMDAVPELERIVTWKRIGSRYIPREQAGTDFDRRNAHQMIVQVTARIPKGTMGMTNYRRSSIYGWEIVIADPSFSGILPGGRVYTPENIVRREIWSSIRTFLEDIASDPGRRKGSGWMKW